MNTWPNPSKDCHQSNYRVENWHFPPINKIGAKNVLCKLLRALHRPHRAVARMPQALIARYPAARRHEAVRVAGWGLRTNHGACDIAYGTCHAPTIFRHGRRSSWRFAFCVMLWALHLSGKLHCGAVRRLALRYYRIVANRGWLWVEGFNRGGQAAVVVDHHLQLSRLHHGDTTTQPTQ